MQTLIEENPARIAELAGLISRIAVNRRVLDAKQRTHALAMSLWLHVRAETRKSGGYGPAGETWERLGEVKRQLEDTERQVLDCVLSRRFNASIVNRMRALRQTADSLQSQLDKTEGAHDQLRRLGNECATLRMELDGTLIPELLTLVEELGLFDTRAREQIKEAEKEAAEFEGAHGARVLLTAHAK